MNGWMILVAAVLVATGLWIAVASGYGSYADSCGLPPKSTVDQHNVGFALFTVGLLCFAAAFLWDGNAPPASRKRAAEEE